MYEIFSMFRIVYGSKIVRHIRNAGNSGRKSDRLYGRNHDDNFAESISYSDLARNELNYNEKNKRAKKARNLSTARDQSELHEATLEEMAS